MRSSFHIDEITNYVKCPERERRRKLEIALPTDEDRYKECVRKILVRYHTELLGGHKMSYSELRRMWGTFWKIPTTLIDRRLRKDTASELNAMLTPQESLLLRGVRFLQILAAQDPAKLLYVSMVNEPYSLDFGDITIEGTFDVVYRYKHGHDWIVDWVQDYLVPNIDKVHDLRHSVMMAAYIQKTNTIPTGIMCDFSPQGFDALRQVFRNNKTEFQTQIQEAVSIARALQLEIHYRSIGPGCNKCPYIKSCLGVTSVKSR